MMAHIRARRTTSTTSKHPGGRPPLDVDVAGVLDSIANGTNVTETAKLMGISRQAVYRAIHSSPHGSLLRDQNSGK